MISLIDEADETATPPSGETETTSEAPSASEEEIEEGDVGKKPAEARINDLLAKNRILEEKLDTVLERTAPPPPPVPEPLEPDVEKAISFFKKLGFVTNEELNGVKQTLKDEQTLNSEYYRLSSIYSGEDGRPKFVKSDVEDYMRKNGVYNPEVAYKALHETELTDYALRKAEEDRTQRPYVEKKSTLSANRTDNTISREKLQQVIANFSDPKNRLWYERNREKILELNAKG